MSKYQQNFFNLHIQWHMQSYNLIFHVVAINFSFFLDIKMSKYRTKNRSRLWHLFIQEVVFNNNCLRIKSIEQSAFHSICNLLEDLVVCPSTHCKAIISLPEISASRGSSNSYKQSE